MKRWWLIINHYVTPINAVATYVLQPNAISNQYWNGILEWEIALCTNDWEQCVCPQVLLSKCQSRSEGDHEELNNQLKPLQDYAVVNVDNHNNNKTK